MYQALVEDRIFIGAAGDVQDVVDRERVDVVVDLREEATASAASAPGLRWLRIPLGDNAQELQPQLFADAIQAVVDAYRAGYRVAFHCGGGKGRTGTVAVGVLMELGICQDLDEANLMARTIRPVIHVKPDQRAALELLYPANLPGRSSASAS